MNGDGNEVIRGWCLEQLAPWLLRNPAPDDVTTERDRFNQTFDNVFLVSIRDGQISIADKPRDMALPQIAVDRLRVYREFFQDVVREHQIDIDTTFVLDVGDGGIESSVVPVFLFQKTQDRSSVLIPDIDFLGGHFYETDEYQDSRSYNEKTASAIFVGSTSGTLYTEEVVRALAPPRLRSAAYFRDKAGITFLLPNLAQCDTPQTEALLRSMGFGDGRYVKWREQFQHKFVLSMDGNGATCSRVVAALKSNSVLVKYASPHMLYYFSQLVPWFHYIPVASDADVERVVALEQSRPGLFEFVAQQGRIFAERYLCRSAVQLYTAQLLRLYAENEWKSSHPRCSTTIDPAGEKADKPIRAEYLAHVQDRGDVWPDAAGWAGFPDSKLRVEGLLLLPIPGVPPQEIVYQVVTEGGTESSWASAGEFCGSRGASIPIIGFRMRLLGTCAERFSVTYSATFTDGSRCGPLAGGNLCTSATLSPVEALNVTISCGPARAAEVTGDVQPVEGSACDGGSRVIAR